MATRRRRSYPRYTRRYRRRAHQKIPLAPTLGLIGTIATAKHPWAAEGDTFLNKLMKQNFQGALNDIPGAFLGVDPKGDVHWDSLLRTWMPTIAGIGVHMTIGRFANKYLKKIPYVNI